MAGERGIEEGLFLRSIGETVGGVPLKRLREDLMWTEKSAYVMVNVSFDCVSEYTLGTASVSKRETHRESK